MLDVPGRPLLVVNPASGGGKTGKTFESLRATIGQALGPVRVAFTERRGHAIELARQGVRDGHALIVAVGGDGTFHEVVNGVMDEPSDRKVRVGLIAQGTGGDFRKTLGIEHRLDHYLAALTGGRTRQIDVGRVHYRDRDGSDKTRWFVNILSCGMGGLVDRYVAEAPAFLGGKLAYLGASVGALARCKEGRVHAKIHSSGTSEERRLRTYMIAICNGRYFGGGMHVAPMAQPDDGRFEVVSMGAASKLGFVAYSSKIYDGTHLRERGVEHFPCDAIELELENDDARDVFLNDIDGEPLGGLPVRVELHRGALTLQA
ncbi:MAG: diacylglycerol kinase family lipid kinase [Deltaproteobacteria bacterium]|nr:diacylglycerol kinase family lipid kinase [Deltaproteobacteria bacterium]